MPKGLGVAVKRFKEVKAISEDIDGLAKTTNEERGIDVPAAVYTKPAKTKTWPDGSIRTWDDYAQDWKIVQKATK